MSWTPVQSQAKDPVEGEGSPSPPPGLQPKEQTGASYSNARLKKKIARVVDEYAVQLLTGRPAPPMNPSEQVLLAERAERWESKLPTGNPPELTKNQRDAERWDSWNWWDG